MKPAYRRVTKADTEVLFDIRRNSIKSLATKTMSSAQAENWAADLTLAGMARKIAELELWVAEVDGAVVGWGAIRADHLEGLYTDPERAGQGIGSGLLNMLEGLLRQRGIAAVHAEASWNAETFYFQRGYEAIGPRSPAGATPIVKQFS
jgi:putative acetyltransferase